MILQCQKNKNKEIKELLKQSTVTANIGTMDSMMKKCQHEICYVIKIAYYAN